MSLLFRVVYAWKCKGTHHKLAVDALRLLGGERADRWRNLFLTHFDAYLEGAKAPDVQFKDFRNHVLHVEDGYWGGAVAAAEQWYQQTVDALRSRQWKQAVYSAGVLSHYVTDPIMPLHTGQSERENNIHRACEWSVSKSYELLLDLLEEQLGGYTAVEVPSQDQWLKRLITRSAATAHVEYDRIVDGYDFAQGVKKPQAGLNAELQEVFAQLLGLATSVYHAVLARAISESEAKPPLSFPTLKGVLASVNIPIDWIARKMEDAGERRLVKSIYRELQQTGRVEQTLPEENRVIRQLHAKEVLGTSEVPAVPASVEEAPTERTAQAPTATPQTVAVREPAAVIPVTAAKPIKKAKLSGPAPRFYLEPDDPIVDAPSIGPKTARKLQQVGISCVEVFLEYTPADVVSLLEVNTISIEDIRTWQQQARLMCQVPGLRGHDVQMLVACGVTSPEQLATEDLKRLHQQVCRFVETPTARRIMRNPQPPEKDEVKNWIAWGTYSRPLRAA
ncbi:MAG: DUF4332 domain-containing protein [Planctomycetaceae bacterium]|nr:DUF4332 domain-containing protein [Planctomycetaceae bacterium]